MTQLSIYVVFEYKTIACWKFETSAFMP